MIISDLTFVENVTSEEAKVTGAGKKYYKKPVVKKPAAPKAFAAAEASALAIGTNAFAVTSTDAIATAGFASAKSTSVASVGYKH